jgi:CDP-paratose synthetase
MPKKILMTGITGFLGSQLAKELLNKGYEVIALKRRSSSLKKIESILSRVILYDLESIDFSETFQSHPEIDTIIHTATCYGRNNESTCQITEANTSFPLRLLDAAISSGINSFINTDTTLDKSLNKYSLSKNQFREWGKYYSLQNEIHFTNLKLEHFYGPGDGESKFTTYVIKNCLDKNIPELKLTLGEQKRDFIYINDVISAYLILLEKKNTFSDGFKEFEIGSGHAVSIKDFATIVHRLSESECILNFGAIPYRKEEVMLSEANIAPLTKLGWTCKTALEQGLKMTLESMKQ